MPAHHAHPKPHATTDATAIEATPAPAKKNREADTRGATMLSGSLWREVPLFAVPVAATSILEQLFNLVGVAVMGQCPGTEGTVGMAAIGSDVPIVSLILYLFIGLSLGSNVTIANAVGSGDRDMVRRAVHTSLLLSLLGVVVAVGGQFACAPLLRALNVPSDTFPAAELFLRIYLLGMPGILLYNFEAAIFRSVGITRMPLQALVAAFLLNVLLDLLFVRVLGWGVAGVAAAAGICYSVSALVLLVRLVRRDDDIRVRLADLRADGIALGRIVRIGLPAGIQSAVFAVANVIIQGAINSLGTETMAACGASQSIEYVCYNVITSYSQACTTFVGQNYGARKIARCRETLRVCLIEDLAVCLVLVGTVLGFGHQILGAFNADPAVIAIGYQRVCYLFPSYFFSMVYENVSGYLRGYGVSLAPALITTLSVCGIRFAWVGLVFPGAPTFDTIMAVYPISLCATMVLLLGVLAAVRPARTLGREGTMPR